MTITITIDCNNAAFDPPEPEIARILKTVCDKLEYSIGHIDGIPLMDVNGNRVGRVEITD